MTDFAIVKIGGKQFKVKKGDVIEVEKLKDGKGKIKLEEILLTSEGGKVKIGAPTVKGASITGTLLEEKKGKKIRVAKFKSKVRYRKSLGFRPLLTRLEIEKIEF